MGSGGGFLDNGHMAHEGSLEIRAIQAGLGSNDIRGPMGFPNKTGPGYIDPFWPNINPQVGLEQ